MRSRSIEMLGAQVVIDAGLKLRGIEKCLAHRAGVR
jgi:hypothetical protein